MAIPKPFETTILVKNVQFPEISNQDWRQEQSSETEEAFAMCL